MIVSCVLCAGIAQPLRTLGLQRLRACVLDKRPFDCIRGKATNEVACRRGDMLSLALRSYVLPLEVQSDSSATL